MLHLLRSKIMAWRWAPDNQEATFRFRFFAIQGGEQQAVQR